MQNFRRWANIELSDIYGTSRIKPPCQYNKIKFSSDKMLCLTIQSSPTLHANAQLLGQY